jgi:outer membrane protein W
MKNILILILLLFFYQLSHSQVYIEKQTRHRFAQLNLGLDLQTDFGGTTKYIDAQGSRQILNLTNSYSPRFLIGGTHFWGHADFYIGIPLFSASYEKHNQEVTAQRGVETVFKYYPLRIENNKIRPYIGTSITPIYFEQGNNNFLYPSGPELNYTGFPLTGGITFNSKNHLIEFGLTWNYRNQHDYYISRTQLAQINTPPVYATLSYRYMLETTLSAERNWESGKTKEVTEILAERGRLNGFYIGAGISSAFWLKESSYNQDKRPYISKFDNSIMPDFTVGYYFHKPDLNFAIAYRRYRSSTDAYGAIQQLYRQSFLLEATKYLFDYHGFVPFLGPTISYENLSFREDFEGQLIYDIDDKKLGYGLTFGWDIRPNRIQSWILRTNLRWYQNLFLEIEPNSKMSFDNLEFNFIQLIIYPKRMLKQKEKS